MRFVGYLATGLVAGVLLGAAVVAIRSTDDIKRYQRIRDM